MKFVPVAMVSITAAMFFASSAATPWEEYLQKPSPDRASRVLCLAYSETSRLDRGDAEMDLALLEVQVISRDTEAVRLAFRLLATTAGGHYSEMLDIMLGRLIRIDPTLFLRELKRAGCANYELGHLLGNAGPEYVDRFEADTYELAMREASLRQVSDRGLKMVRDECVAELQELQELTKE